MEFNNQLYKSRQRANTIEGGTEEIQKYVIAKQVLGL